MSGLGFGWLLSALEILMCRTVEVASYPGTFTMPAASCTWTPKVCKIMACMAIITGLGLLFYILLGFRYQLCERGLRVQKVLSRDSRFQVRFCSCSPPATLKKQHCQCCVCDLHELRTKPRLGGNYRGLYRVWGGLIKGYTTDLSRAQIEVVSCFFVLVMLRGVDVSCLHVGSLGLL